MSVQLDCQNFKRGTAFVAGVRNTGRSVMERTKMKDCELCDCIIDNVILANSTLINVTGTTTDSFHNSVGVPSTSVGDSAEASAASSIAVGVDCLASGADSTAYGIRADVSGPRAICIGTDANVTGADSIGIARNISVTGARSIAIGYQVDTALDDTVSYGQALTPGIHSLALGHNISMSSDAQRNVAISAHNAALPQINSTSTDNVLLGHWVNTVVSTDQNVMIGYGNQLADNSVNGRVVIGNGNTCSFASSLALGTSCVATGVSAIAIGSTCISNSQGGIAIGSNTSATGVNAISIGGSANAPTNSISLGAGSVCSSNLTIALGTSAISNASSCTAIGVETTAAGEFATVVGRDSYAGAGSLALGAFTEALNTYSIVIGTGEDVNVALQEKFKNTVPSSVRIGYRDSSTNFEFLAGTSTATHLPKAIERQDVVEFTSNGTLTTSEFSRPYWRVRSTTTALSTPTGAAVSSYLGGHLSSGDSEQLIIDCHNLGGSLTLNSVAVSGISFVAFDGTVTTTFVIPDNRTAFFRRRYTGTAIQLYFQGQITH